MNWEDVRIFEAAAAARSLSGAAKALGSSQPQLSRRLRQLEDSVGARLFDRTPQGLRPTLAGEKLIPLARQMRVAADAVARAQPDLARTALGVVRVSVDEVRAQFLVSHFSDLKDQLAGIELEIFSSHLHISHVTRETDIQIRSCLPDSETLIVRRLGQMAYAPYVSKAYLEGRACNGNASDYAGWDWIGLTPDRLWYPEQKRWMDARFTSPPIVRVNTMTSAMDAAIAGLGATMLPCFMADQDESLVAISLTEERMISSENLVVHRDLLREPAIRKTIDAIAALYKRERQALSGN